MDLARSPRFAAVSHTTRSRDEALRPERGGSTTGGHEKWGRIPGGGPVFLAVLLAFACGAPGDDPNPATDSAQPAASSPDPATEPAAPGLRHLPGDDDRAAILATVQSLFDALATGDGQILREIMHPDVLMHSVERAADGMRSTSTSTREELIARLEGSDDTLIERMFDPEVRISGDLAMVWTPYDFYIGSDFSHCGADALLLTRGDDDAWSIVALSWTRLQPPRCELHPDGTPA